MSRQSGLSINLNRHWRDLLKAATALLIIVGFPVFTHFAGPIRGYILGVWAIGSIPLCLTLAFGGMAGRGFGRSLAVVSISFWFALAYCDDMSGSHVMQAGAIGCGAIVCALVIAVLAFIKSFSKPKRKVNVDLDQEAQAFLRGLAPQPGTEDTLRSGQDSCNQ